MQNDIVRQQPKQTEEPTAKPIDDIKPPAQPAAAPATPPENTASSASDETTGSENPAPTPDGTSNGNAAANKNQPEAKKTEQVKKPAAPRQTSTKPLGVITAAVAVCALLVGLTIYGSLSQKDEVAAPAAKPTTSTTGAKTDGSLTQELDNSINDAATFTDETGDAATELSDEALGL